MKTISIGKCLVCFEAIEGEGMFCQKHLRAYHDGLARSGSAIDLNKLKAEAAERLASARKVQP